MKLPYDHWLTAALPLLTACHANSVLLCGWPLRFPTAFAYQYVWPLGLPKWHSSSLLRDDHIGKVRNKFGALALQIRKVWCFSWKDASCCRCLKCRGVTWQEPCFSWRQWELTTSQSLIFWTRPQLKPWFVAWNSCTLWVLLIQMAGAVAARSILTWAHWCMVVDIPLASYGSQSGWVKKTCTWVLQFVQINCTGYCSLKWLQCSLLAGSTLHSMICFSASVYSQCPSHRRCPIPSHSADFSHFKFALSQHPIGSYTQLLQSLRFYTFTGCHLHWAIKWRSSRWTPG